MPRVMCTQEREVFNGEMARSSLGNSQRVTPQAKAKATVEIKFSSGNIHLKHALHLLIVHPHDKHAPSHTSARLSST